jgi:hypothetical protein
MSAKRFISAGVPSQCKDIQKTLNEKNLCYNFVILFQTNNKIITNVYISLFGGILGVRRFTPKHPKSTQKHHKNELNLTQTFK